MINKNMEKNRKNFLHKVVEFLVKDTIIDYGDNHIDFPFFPSYRLYINDANLDYFFHKGRYSQYCKDNYGLTHEESLYVWGIYIDMIKEKINTNGESLNESDDRRKNFLDKVVDFLVKDTKVNYDNKTLFFPFTYNNSLRQGSSNLTTFHKRLFDTYIPIDGFTEYIDEMYGINLTEDIDYVWETYKVIMYNIVFGNNASPLYFNESEDRRKNFLDKVVDFIVKDTKVDYEDRELFFPFTLKKSFRQNSDNSTPFHKILFNKDSVIPRDGFMEYIEEMYGINTIEDISYVWGKYKDVMRYTVFGNDPTSEPIYESEDKKQKYLDKIIDWLVSDTDVDGLWFEPPYKTGLIYAENSITLSSLYKQTFNLLNYVTDVEEVKFVIQMNYFKKFCIEQYGLTEDETEYVWKGFMKDLYESEKYNSLNESEDRKQKYLDKILKWFVDDTIIRYETGVIIYPFSQIGPNGKPLPSFIDDLKNKLSWGMSSDIQITCRDTYGLNYDETKYIWNNYKKIIKDRYNKESIMYDLKPINESDDKKQVYLDKIVNWLVRDTEVEVNYNWFNPPYYHPGSSAGRTGFRSVYEHTFGLLRDTNYSGLDSQLIYFNHYCKNNYGLTGEENKIVWFEYMKQLKESYDWGF
jgi:hypothetical protein